MVERRDAGCSHSQQYSSVRGRWFWKIYELQSFITTEFFRSHYTHISSTLLSGVAFWRTATSHIAVPTNICSLLILRFRFQLDVAAPAKLFR